VPAHQRIPHSCHPSQQRSHPLQPGLRNLPRYYVNNLAWQSTRVEVDYHDFSHNEPHTWDSATFTPADNKKHGYVISDAVYGSEDLDHIIIKIDAFENGSWKTEGTPVEYRPADCTSDFPPI
jgi:hypothetical protein